MKKSLTALALLSSLCANAFAGGPGTSAVAALKLDGAARPMAMGGAFTAVADDACSIFYNPAGLTQQQNAEAMLTHTEFVSDIRSEYIAVAGNANGGWNWGAGANFLFSTNLAGYDENGAPTGDFGASEGFGVLALAVPLTPNLSVGAGAKYVRQSIDSYSASAIAGDGGILWRLGRVRLGAAVQNVGQDIKLGSDAFPLPLAYSGGASVKVTDPLTLSAEYRKYNDGDAGLHAGGEYAFAQFLGIGDILFLRGGYQTGRSVNTGPGFSAGLGFSLNSWKIDYAFAPWGDLGNVHRITLGLRFGMTPDQQLKPVLKKDDFAAQPRKKDAARTETAPEQDGKPAPAPVKKPLKKQPQPQPKVSEDNTYLLL